MVLPAAKLTAGSDDGKLYSTVLRAFMMLSMLSYIVFIAALCVALGPALDWQRFYEETNCTVTSVQTTGEVECSVPTRERTSTADKGLFVVPCVQVNVSYTNSTGSERNCDIAMPCRSVLLAEYSGGSQQREYNSADYIGPPIPGPDGKVDTGRVSTLTRPLFSTRTCTYLDCRTSLAETEKVNAQIAERYPIGMTLPCWIYTPRQNEIDLAALVVLRKAQTDAVVLSWTVTSLLALMCTFPPCFFLCCREWWCRCPQPLSRLQYF
ncbi:hypothetical protein T492DRAFT_1012089 [Pavlovales sp. CCMP2436]|nr:hypothetical protein T492DRAFT_1012089 [Pavlovales sp. CCMP2436]|mmetsp:Transcript_242/g.661  ORF Transcript_242/g.661 Transcript_242/m.661 type:complete len:266 (+) Transcript_242:240-1037(+)